MRKEDFTPETPATPASELAGLTRRQKVGVALGVAAVLGLGAVVAETADAWMPDVMPNGPVYDVDAPPVGR